MGPQAAVDHQRLDRATGLDAEGNGCELNHDALDQRVADAAEGFDATPYRDGADGLASLYPGGAVRVGHHGLQLRGPHRPVFVNDPASTQTYALSLHDALPN